MVSPRSPGRLLPVVVLALTLLGTSGALAAPPRGLTGPPRQMVLGVGMLPYQDVGMLDQFAVDSGGMPAIWMVWRTWANGQSDFPAALMEELREREVTPLVNWQPVDGDDIWSSAYTHRKIANGDHDAYIRGWAQEAKDFGGTILLRYAQEFDGNWFPWGIGNFDNTPATFLAAWRHIWDIFRGPDGVGATNVKFVWSPTTPGSKRPAWSTLYPGDAFVDYASFTSYNWNRRGVGWKSMVELYGPTIKVIRSFTKKPMIVSETGSTPIGGDKAAWIRDGYRAVYLKWPGIKAIVYFNIDMRPQHKDWRLTSPIGALDAYRELLSLSQFQGRIP